jgi:hypothetical protein
LTLFRDERKKLALLWLCEVRSWAVLAHRRHALSARTDARIQPGMELRVAVRYWCLSATCTMAWCIVHLFGPFRFQIFIQYAARLSHELARIAGDAGLPFGDAPATWIGEERQA